MEQIELIVKMADGSRKARVVVSPEQRISEIVTGAIENWALPKNVDYTVVNITKGRALNLSHTLSQSNTATGDVLEIQPALVGGSLRWM